MGATGSPAHASSQDALSLTLHWTAPGDDGKYGRATLYDLRCSDRPLTLLNFSAGVKVPVLLKPAASGAAESLTVSGLNPTVTYYFALRTADEAGNWSGLSNVLIRPSFFGDVSVPGGFELSFANPWPNPARSGVRIAYTLPTESPVSVNVFDVAGRLVRTLIRGTGTVGRTELSWNLVDEHGRMVEAGIYLIRANLKGEAFTRRVVVMR